MGKNDYIETSRPLVVVTAPGPGSGKMAVCLSQLYHEYKRGIKAGYAKFETFPIWNLPLKHPVNLAYEAATADLEDVNMIDPFHLAAYGETTVNYNRDVEVFPVLSAMFEKIMGQCPYKSPTDMGVNMAGNCIVDDEAVCAAARQEIVRRYYAALCDRRVGPAGRRAGVQAGAADAAGQGGHLHPARGGRRRPGGGGDRQPRRGHRAARRGGGHRQDHRPDGRLLRHAAQRPQSAWRASTTSSHLISPEAIEPIQTVKVNHLGSANPRLHSDETLIALAISRHDQPAGRAGAGAAGPPCGAARPTPPSSSPRRTRAPTASLGLQPHLRAPV